MQKTNDNNQGKKQLSKKQKHKGAFIVIAIFICIDLIVGGILLYMKHIANQGYTEYDLSKRDFDVLVIFLDIYIPEYIEAPETFTTDNKYNWNKNDFELVQGEYCEQQIEKLNSLLYEEDKAKNAAAQAGVYGFSSENQITADWVMTHPYEALTIIMLTYDYNTLHFELYINPHGVNSAVFMFL